MAEERNISFHLTDDKNFKNPVWAISDTLVPAIGDSITIESVDDAFDTYRVVGRNWNTAKQGASSFTQVRVIVAEVTDPWFL
ncbi:MAG TPA: hypothetical protein VI168_00840 [Croceibacterium sp.]